MKKPSPWAGGWRPHAAAEPVKLTCAEVTEIVNDIMSTTVAAFIDRCEGMPEEWQGATAMSLADRLTALFLNGLTQGDKEKAAAMLTQHTINVLRRIREEDNE